MSARLSWFSRGIFVSDCSVNISNRLAEDSDLRQSATEENARKYL